jgi:hypothetical protein
MDAPPNNPGLRFDAVTLAGVIDLADSVRKLQHCSELFNLLLAEVPPVLAAKCLYLAADGTIRLKVEPTEDIRALLSAACAPEGQLKLAERFVSVSTVGAEILVLHDVQVVTLDAPMQPQPEGDDRKAALGA